jgi:hypothetical protein
VFYGISIGTLFFYYRINGKRGSDMKDRAAEFKKSAKDYTEGFRKSYRTRLIGPPD